MTADFASLEDTVVGAWDIQHPLYGYRHVLAYQNAPQNLAVGPNCMLLHIPTAYDLVATDLVDTSTYPDFLIDLNLSFGPSLRSVTMSAPQNHIVEMGIYHIVVLNDINPSALEAVLEQIPSEKRPTIAPELLDFYVQNFPNYRLVLACFNNRKAKKASPIMVHYAPLFPNKIFFPLLDGHDGKVPNLGQKIMMHQELIFGSYLELAHLDKVHLKLKKANKGLEPFLPKYAGRQSLKGEILPNEDDWFSLIQNEEYVV